MAENPVQLLTTRVARPPEVVIDGADFVQAYVCMWVGALALRQERYRGVCESNM
jgi:hypothetical protein